ncbi:hypothetical protein C1H46_020822 [Malus baccata]|uniref:Uncharacterized protein n=1 Tax=Malus baccata TaxID=106549 RepID=A0A540M488_MALBA|nr:hypothetical protein C1H46_020822 [Malus baccata]
MGIWGEVEYEYLLTTHCDCTRIDCTSSEPMVVVLLLLGFRIKRMKVGLSVWVWVGVQHKEEEDEGRMRENDEHWGVYEGGGRWWLRTEKRGYQRE